MEEIRSKKINDTTKQKEKHDMKEKRKEVKEVKT